MKIRNGNRVGGLFGPASKQIVEMFHELLMTASALIGIFGTTATYIGLKAFRRSGDGSLLFASAGFSLITIGTVLGGLVYVFFTHNMVEIYFAQSGMVALGLFSIIYSISRAGGLAKPR